MPMRLALSEVWPKEDCGAACSAGLPHTRLAAKLLRQKALGSSSAWQRYLAVRCNPARGDNMPLTMEAFQLPCRATVFCSCLLESVWVRIACLAGVA